MILPLEQQVCGLKYAKRLKGISGFEGFYAIDMDGNVYSLPRKNGYGSRLKLKIKKPKITRGYWQFSLSKNGRNIYKSVHRLLAETFIPNPLWLPQVNHINGIKTDNRLKNLEWCTHSDNQIHARKIGLMGGERTNTAKLTVGKVKEIRALYPRLNSRQLSEKYGIGQSTICKILNREYWKWI